MSKCALCSKKGKWGVHHINGKGSVLPVEQRDNRKTNLIVLCNLCHDKVEAVCSKCFARNNCNNRKFKECWRFEDALPPINFKSREDIFVDSLNVKEIIRESFEAKCPKCKSSKIARISIWDYDGVYKSDCNWIAIYKCKKCGYKFIRTLNSLSERAIDNDRIPIEIEDWGCSCRNLRQEKMMKDIIGTSKLKDTV